LNRRPLARKAFSIASKQTFDWAEFKDWVFKKYAISYAHTIMLYTKKYNHLLTGNLREIDKIPETTRNNAVKSLIILSKYLGVHEEFKCALKSYGVKLQRPDAFSSFTRMYTNPSSDLWKWYVEVEKILRPEEQLFLKYLKLSGLRKEEGITSFNLIIALSKQNKLTEYLNEDGLLEHFKYKKPFLRGTKNVYISILAAETISEISRSQPVTYNSIIKRLQRKHQRCRLNELRDYFGTFMVRHGLIKEEVDLLQGRIPPSIFIRHYWSPSFKELRNRTLKALAEM
jgi:intergrase/recombinase